MGDVSYNWRGEIRPVASFFDWGATGAVCAARHGGSLGVPGAKPLVEG